MSARDDGDDDSGYSFDDNKRARSSKQRWSQKNKRQEKI
jgi:hypothetical protein